jgi:transcriptional regulator with XRE-family HTH domain
MDNSNEYIDLTGGGRPVFAAYSVADARGTPSLRGMTDLDPREVGLRVRREREKAGLSLAQLAAIAGLTKPYLVKLENQGGNPTLGALHGIAAALDVTIADLVGGPKLVVDDQESSGDIPPSLKAYAAEADLSSVDVRMLASIKWRQHQRPHSPERWRFIHQSLQASESLDTESDGDSD